VSEGKSTAYKMAAQLPPPSRRLRLGLVGGGGGGFIGPVHALAARMDDRFELVAGALSSRPDVARRSAEAFFLAPGRAYADFNEMARAEAARQDGIEVAAITVPNHLHFAAAKAFLENGIHVICDKPLTTRLEDAVALADLVTKTGLGFFVTHAFAAYPMVREARRLVRDGRLGEVRLVHVEFVMDWLTEPIDLMGDPHAAWRTDPARSGPGGAIADIGTHAYHLARFVSGQDVVRISAALYTITPGRRLDDNGHLLLTFGNGAQGTMIVTQVAPGNECGLRIRVYGTKAGLEWRQETSNYLSFAEQGRPMQTLGRREASLSADAQRMTRVPRGHPEGYLEAFANVYSEASVALLAKIEGRTESTPIECATVEDGVIGVAFVEAAVRSSRKGGAWVDPRPGANGALRR
jgi:predicted dehydrogenase